LRLPASHNRAAGDGSGTLRRGDNRGRRWSYGALFFANGRSVDFAIGSDGEGGYFALRSFIEDEAVCRRGVSFSGRGPAIYPCDADDSATGFRACEETSERVEREHADMRFIASVEEFAFSVGRDGEDLPFIAGGDKERAIRG